MVDESSEQEKSELAPELSNEIAKSVAPEVNDQRESHFEPVKVKAMKNIHQDKNKSSSFITWIILILVILSFAVSGYLWQQLQYVSGDLLKNSSYQLDLQTNQQTISKLESSLNQAQEKLATNEASFKALQQDQDQLISKISNISGVNKVDWLVDELQHLSRLAHQRLILSHDAKGAVALLKAADKVVIEMRESSALPVRQAIANDLLALNMAANVDLEGAYIRLNGLTTKIEDLTFKVTRFPEHASLNVIQEENVSDETLEEEAGNQFENALAHVIAKIQPYLYRSFPIENKIRPILSGEERQYFSRNIQLALEQAQLALLRREAKSYRLSLEQCEEWIKQYYDEGDPSTTSILSLLNELKSYRLSPEMPEINETLDAVKSFTEAWQENKIQQSQPKGV